MKKTISVLLTAMMIFAVGCGGADPGDTDGEAAKGKEGTVTVNGYDLAAILDTEAKTIECTEEIRFTNDTEGNLDEICIRDYIASIIDVRDASGESTIKSVKAGGKELEQDVKKDPSVVYVKLNEPLKVGEELKVSLEYRADIPEAKDRYGYHESKHGSLFAMCFFYPVLAMYENGSWDEDPYIDMGEANYSRCTDFNIEITAPESYEIAASGDEEKLDAAGGQTVWKVTAEDMRDVAFVACDYMKKETREVDGIDINNYYFDIDGAHADYIKYSMDAAVDSVKVFNEAYGKYPYGELDVVETRLGAGGGMECCGLVMISGDDYIGDVYDLAAMETASLVAHEIAHEWFYAAVGNDQYNEAWLDEGFAEFSDFCVYQRAGTASWQDALADAKRKTGDDYSENDKEFAEYMKDFEELVSGGDTRIINRPANEFIDEDGYYTSVYDLGMCFLFQLKEAMGEDRFDKVMKEYYQTYKLKEAKTEDFIKIVEKHDKDNKTEKIIEKFIEL